MLNRDSDNAHSHIMPNEDDERCDAPERMPPKCCYTGDPCLG